MYIGQTKYTLDTRKAQHKYEAFTRVGSLAFHCALRKYGMSSFIWQELAQVSSTIELNILEVFYVGLYKSNDKRWGYNLTAGGDARILSEQGEENFRKGIMRRNANPAYMAQLIDRAIRIAKDPAYIEKRRTTQRTSANTEAGKARIRQLMVLRVQNGWHDKVIAGIRQRTEKGEWLEKMKIVHSSDEWRAIAKANGVRQQIHILCIETGLSFSSLKEAGKFYGISPANISRVIHGLQKTAAGFHWEVLKLGTRPFKKGGTA